MNTQKNYRGLTLMEIIVSSVILAITLLGLLNLFISSKRWLRHTQSRMVSTELERGLLEPLYGYVRAQARKAGANDGWNQTQNALNVTISYCDSDSTHPQLPPGACPSVAERTIDGITYDAQYTITEPFAAAGLGIRKVELTVRWNETAP